MSQPAAEPARSELFDALGDDFGVTQQEGLDMLFLDLPDMQPQIIEVRPAYVVVAKSGSDGYLGNFGFCMIADSEGSRNGGIDITWPFYDLIPKRILKALDDSGRLGVSVLEPEDDAWFAKWSESFSVKVLREPQYGEFKRHGNSQFVGYTPTEGYLGKDRMDILIEGKAPDGRPVSARANIFIRVDSSENLRGLLGKDSTMKAYIKKNCPAPTEFWKIDRKPSAGRLEDGNVIDKLLASLVLDRKIFAGFAELQGAGLAQAAGTGSDAKITLDPTAAGHGWFIDATPTYNEEFLPTADPNVWVAKAGSAAEGKMDMLSVLLHEYGHVLGLDHSADGADAMAATLKPGERRLWSAGDLAALARLGVSYVQMGRVNAIKLAKTSL